MTPYSIGVDLGGTNMRAAAITREGKVISKTSGRAPLSAGRDAVIDDMVNAIRQMATDAGDGLSGVGIGVPGFIRLETGFLVGSNNLPQLENYPIREEISKRLGAPVILENDANAAALGEKWMGAGRDVSDLVLMTLGTGIGGGIISAGRIVRGCVGMAGELGHITVVPNGNPCGCGNIGCLEKHASATAISAMARMMQLGEDLESKDVFDIAQTTGPRADKARTIFTCMGSALGIALATLVNTFNYPLYLLSGGPLPAWDLFAPAMFDELKRRSFTYRNSETRIEKATLGNEAGLFGAAYLPFLPPDER